MQQNQQRTLKMFKNKASLIVTAGLDAQRAYHFLFDHDSPFEEAISVLKFVIEGIEKLQIDKKLADEAAAAAQPPEVAPPAALVPVVEPIAAPSVAQE